MIIAMKTFLLSVVKQLTYIMAGFIILAAIVVSTMHLLTPVLNKHHARL